MTDWVLPDQWVIQDVDHTRFTVTQEQVRWYSIEEAAKRMVDDHPGIGTEMDFLRFAAEDWRGNRGKTNDWSRVTKIRHRLQAGLPIDPPFEIKDTGYSDGFHRLVAAYLEGLDEVPWVIIG